MENVRRIIPMSNGNELSPEIEALVKRYGQLSEMKLRTEIELAEVDREIAKEEFLRALRKNLRKKDSPQANEEFCELIMGGRHG